MHKEFEEWVDKKITAHGFNPETMDRAQVLVLMQDMLAEVSGVQQFESDRQQYRLTDEVVNQMQGIKSDVVGMIQECCGENVGKGFCESFGCSTLFKIGTQLTCAINDAKKK